jgi:hypothetical protein
VKYVALNVTLIETTTIAAAQAEKEAALGVCGDGSAVVATQEWGTSVTPLNY